MQWYVIVLIPLMSQYGTLCFCVEKRTENREQRADVDVDVGVV